MAHTAFFTASVGPAMAEVKRFKIYPKIGKITFAFLSTGQRDNNGVVSGNHLTFKIEELETTTGVWSQIGSNILVAQGAQRVVTVISKKQFIRVSGQGLNADGTTTNAGGSAKVDVTHNGIQYFGQVDPDVTGKSGYSKDGVAATTDNGIGNYNATAWPE